MHSPGPLPLLDTLETNQGVIHTELKDITHAESLVLPSFNANSLNWVLGHIADSRDQVLRLLGEGLTGKEVALRLNCTPRWVRQQVTDIRRRCGISITGQRGRQRGKGFSRG